MWSITSVPFRRDWSSKIEESGFVLFTQKMDRQKAPADQTPSDLAESALILRNFIKIMSLLGLIIFIFGVNYSELALLIYGGRPLSAGDNGLATGLLQWHSLYILFIAINGITECFTFAAMNSRQLDAFNKNMIYISVVFLMSSYLLTKWWGSQGFIMANCLNMGSRIAISVRFIKSYYGSTKVVEPLNGSIPHQFVLWTFVSTFGILFTIKPYLCCAGDSTTVTQMIVYVFLGAICVTINLMVIYVKERDLVVFIVNLYKSKAKSL